MTLVTMLPDTPGAIVRQAIAMPSTLQTQTAVLDQIVADVRDALTYSSMSAFTPADLGWHYHRVLQNILEEVSALDRYKLKVTNGEAEDNTEPSVQPQV